jgi:hypothetical protein
MPLALKMANSQHRGSSVLDLAKIWSVTGLQREFHSLFHMEPPNRVKLCAKWCCTAVTEFQNQGHLAEVRNNNHPGHLKQNFRELSYRLVLFWRSKNVTFFRYHFENVKFFPDYPVLYYVLNVKRCSWCKGRFRHSPLHVNVFMFTSPFKTIKQTLL